MKKERLLELAGVQLNESNVNTKYPVVVATYTAKQIFPELKDLVADMVGDGELPEDTEFTVDMLTVEAMNTFVDGVIYMYDEMGSDERRADNYNKAQEATIKAALGK